MVKVPRSPVSKAGKSAEAAWETTVALGVGIFGGYWLDGKFDTSPILLFVGLALGLIHGFRRLMRLARESVEPPDPPQEPPDASE